MKATDPLDSPPPPLRQNFRAEWMLKPGLTFLNHGSFGAVPRAVFDAQHDWRLKIESEPIEILGRRNFELVAEAKTPVARFLGMGAANFGFVTNATEGINAVLRSLVLRPGDELLTTSHVYHAVRQTMRLTARRGGATLREIDIPLPVTSAEQIANLVIQNISDQTRLLVIDHVTSPTGLVFPIEQIAAACAERGVEVLVDGAHAPGMLPLNIETLGVSYYAANLHKWVCAPRGSALLWVTPSRQRDVHPTVISHWLDDGFDREFAWQGTRDVSGWLTVPAALGFLEGLGWERVIEHNHRLAAWAHRHLCRRWGVEPISPLDGSMLGSMAALPLPGRLADLPIEALEALQVKLYREFDIEVPIMQRCDRGLLRVSCQVYNLPDEYERLGDVVLQLEREF